MRLADPRPAYCSVCFAGSGPEVRIVDFEVAHEGPVVLDENGAPMVAPGGVTVTTDDLYICEPCLKSACELLGLKPALHGRQLREIRRLEIETQHWRETAKRAESYLQARPEPAPSAPRRRQVPA